MLFLLHQLCMLVVSDGSPLRSLSGSFKRSDIVGSVPFSAILRKCLVAQSVLLILDLAKLVFQRLQIFNG
jgi:hypothetical protein